MRKAASILTILAALALYFVPGTNPFLPEARAAISQVQTTNATTNGGTSVSASFSSGATAGNLIVAVCGARDSSTLSIPSPSGFSTAVNNTGSPSQGIFYKVAAGGETSINCDSSANTRLGIHIYEFSGTHPTQGSVLDIAATSNTGSGTSVTTNSISTTNANDLLIAAITANNGTSCASWTNSFTEQNDFSNGGQPASRSTYCGATRTVTATGSYSTGATLADSSAWRAGLVAFKESPPPSFAQSAYRFFENVNGTTVGTPMGTQDTPTTLTNSLFRLRILLHVGSSTLSASGQDFKLQFVGKGTGTCASPSGGTPSTYKDLSDTIEVPPDPLIYSDNSLPADGDSLTASAADPTHGADTVVNQAYEEANNFTNSVASIPSGQDGKWDFSISAGGAPANTTYCFRVVKSDGTVLDSYSVYPEMTTSAADTVSCSTNISSTAFGTLTTGSVSTASTNASTTMSCTHSAGCTLTVGDQGNGTNPGLATTTAPAYLIPSNTATLSAGTEGYGIQATTTAGGSGGTLLINPVYNKIGDAVGGLTVSSTPTTLASSTAAVTDRQVLVTHKAAISVITQTSSYFDTITYSCTGN